MRREDVVEDAGFDVAKDDLSEIENQNLEFAGIFGKQMLVNSLPVQFSDEIQKWKAESVLKSKSANSEWEIVKWTCDKQFWNLIQKVVCANFKSESEYEGVANLQDAQDTNDICKSSETLDLISDIREFDSTLKTV
ncbi:hypothetical protein ZIOFF_073725 [Zingiber officinale]|uniref:Uncharacterized protein n=1 Tax=Zingiber officinale TaxID=94328 RepID=A0A8J5BZ08_ZINOF|nr:hypothetical protein ZIOFF_073725 [Zingiber officinale]